MGYNLKMKKRIINELEQLKYQTPTFTPLPTTSPFKQSNESPKSNNLDEIENIVVPPAGNKYVPCSMYILMIKYIGRMGNTTSHLWVQYAIDFSIDICSVNLICGDIEKCETHPSC